MAVAAALAATGLFTWTVVETHHGSQLGLAERMNSGLEASWPFFVALALWRTQYRSTELPGRREEVRIVAAHPNPRV